MIRVDPTPRRPLRETDWTMTPTILLGHTEDVASVGRLAEAIREREPRLDLLVARDDSRIYEPDATLYAVGLAPETTLLARHKERAFRRGDLIVVPRSVAIDSVERGTFYVAILHDGPPPYHFRERFIQTWGYEHRPAATEDLRSHCDDIAPEDDPRYRVPYRRIGVSDGPLIGNAGLDLHLLIGLDGRGTIGGAGGGSGLVIGPDDLALVMGAGDYSIEGRLVIGRFLLRAESSHEARLAAASAGPPAGWSPEFRPES